MPTTTVRPPVPTPPPIPRHHRRGVRRAVSALLAAAVATSVLVVVPAQPAAAASYNQLTFADGSSQKTFGANGTVMIDGVIAYDDGCQYDQGIKDFFYPATDVYLVKTGSVGGVNQQLVDVGGENPNTIVAFTSGVFLDETIAFTSPAGNLGEGVYDIVYDTCQDGFYTEGDAIFPAAVTVRMPEQLPSASPAITQIKDRAREQYISWLQTHTILTALFAADKAKEILACILIPNPGCALAVVAHLFDEGQLGSRQAAKIQDLASALVMNVAKNHGAIWKDPPDADFAQLPVLERPADGDLPGAGQPVFDNLTGLLPALADEAAVTEALLHAMERYQGAQAAGDGDWALAQARAARDLSGVLADHLTGTTAISDLRDAVAADAIELDERLADGRTFANRLRSSGFTPDEERTLANLGLSPAEVNAIEGEQVAAGSVAGYSAQDLVDQLDGLLGARADMAASLVASAGTWDALVATLETGDRALPTADAGGPYAVTGGAAVTLDGSGSTAASGAALLAHDWDLDADGEFDDASGAAPSTTFPTEGSQLVSLRVTDDAGRQAVASAHVTVTGGDQPPVVTSVEPAAATSVEVGETLTLRVVATDPESSPLTFAWTIDGADQAAGDDELSWTPTVDDLGAHAISVVVGDGTSRGTVRTWRVSVTAADADLDGWTETTDCDDSRADVSPSMIERLGNDRDDDCDSGTPDTAPGGLAGRLWSWGHELASGTATFKNQLSPVAVPLLTDDVVAIETSDRRGYAILFSGAVKAWGSNFSGSLGDGTQNERRSPVDVVGVGGDGLLTNVRQVASEIMHTVAVRHDDGSVLAWGANLSGQLGDGSTTGSRAFPMPVVRADGSALVDAVQVEAGESSSYALLADGTAVNWGSLRCSGVYNTGGTLLTTKVAEPMTLLGGDVVQIAAGKGLVLARKADGSVWSCGGDPEELDRGKQSPTLKETLTPTPMVHFPAGSQVIDVSASGTAGFAVTADGTLWGWGHNVNGVLDPIAADQYRVWQPTAIPLPAGAPVVDVDADYACHVEVLRADGSVLSWGCNSFGSGGIGTDTPRTPGVHELALPGRTIAVAASGWNGFALVRPAEDPDLEPSMGWLTASAQDASIGEGTGGTVEVTLSQPALGDVEVSWAVEGGASGTATIPKGAASVAVPVSVTDDTLDEDDEELAFHLVAVSDGIEVDRGVAILTVVDDDAAPAISVQGATVTEGHTALTDATAVIGLSAPSGKDVEVLWATADGSATSPADFASGQGHVLIPAGATEAVVHLTVHGDQVPETAEAFAVQLSEPVNASLDTAAADVTVVDDEPVTLAVISPTVTEGDTGTTDATFTVTATGGPDGLVVTVPWELRAGTASIPEDVAGGAGTLVFDGTRSLTVTVPVAGDDVDELDEVFRLVLGAASADGRPVVATDPTTATVVDDDGPVTDPDPEPDPVPVFDFDGFYQPLDNLPTVNVVQSGRAIPVKFSLGGDHGLDIFEAGYPRSVGIPCEVGDTLDAVEETVSPGSSELTYDAGTDTYHYVWKTQRTWKGQCRRLEVRFVDGTEAVAELRFR